MPWVNTIREQFDLVDRFTTNETEYYGPYNTLLTDLFPHTEHFQVFPLYIRPTIQRVSDFTMLYIVHRRKRPVFFIQIKPFPHLEDKFARGEADWQMRNQFIRTVSNLIIPKLYGISAMGTRFSVYMYAEETNELLPQPIPCDDIFDDDHDVAPLDRWNYELLEPSGEQKIRELVADVKTMCGVI